MSSAVVRDMKCGTTGNLVASDIASNHQSPNEADAFAQSSLGDGLVGRLAAGLG
jgi:hypothetical protein